MPGAMGVIAQQDEDIDTLLGVIDVLKAAGTTTAGAEGGCGGTQTDGDGEGAEAHIDQKRYVTVPQVMDSDAFYAGLLAPGFHFLREG